MDERYDSGAEHEELQRDDDDILSPGTVIGGRYTIAEHIAAGGMGRVYVAQQAPLNRKVALKVMHRDLCADREAVKRFMREAVAVSQLTHPNTITVFDYGESRDGLFYIAMELLDGEPLSDRIRAAGKLPPEDAILITLQVARSLAEAHRKGIIHRDLKPENVFIGSVEKDLVKVLDFGIAKLLQDESEEGTKLTRMGFVCGTPEYMSPEQARGEDLSGSSDIYALGVLLYEMLEGHPPFVESTALATVLKHQSSAPPPLPLSIPEQLSHFIISRVLAKDANHRPATAEAFIEELEVVAIKSGIMLDSTGTIQASELQRAASIAAAEPAFVSPNQARAPRGGRKWLIPLVLGLAVLLLSGVAFALLNNSDPEPKAAEEEAPPKEIAQANPGESPKLPPKAIPELHSPKEQDLIVLQVTSEPEGAWVYEEGIQLGKTPLTLKMEEGGKERTFKFAKDGYVEAEQLVLVPEAEIGALVRVPVHTKLDAMLTIPVQSTPADAIVWLNDKLIGNTPTQIVLPPREKVTLKLELDGYKDHVEELIAANETPLDFKLKQESSSSKTKRHDKGKGDKKAKDEKKTPKDGSEKDPKDEKKDEGSRYCHHR